MCLFCFQMHGFTCGVDDLLLKRSSDMERDRILEKSEMLSEEVHRRFTRMKDDDKGIYYISPLVYCMHNKYQLYGNNCY